VRFHADDLRGPKRRTAMSDLIPLVLDRHGQRSSRSPFRAARTLELNGTAHRVVVRDGEGQ